MRQDFKDLIWDSGRRHSEGWGNRKGRTKEIDFENDPRWEPMHKTAVSNWRGKYSYSSWSAIKNLLTSRVGKAWNNIWHEICKNADERSDSGWNIRKDVLRMVNFNTVEEDGRICDQCSGRYTYGSEFCEIRDNELYVDKNGVLQKYKRKEKAPVKYSVAQVERFISSSTEYRKYDGVWFQIKQTKDFPHKDQYGRIIYPYVDKRFIKWWWSGKAITARNNQIILDHVNDDGKKIFTRTLNKKEIKEIMKQIKECE